MNQSKPFAKAENHKKKEGKKKVTEHSSCTQWISASYIADNQKITSKNAQENTLEEAAHDQKKKSIEKNSILKPHRSEIQGRGIFNAKYTTS